MDIFQPKIKVTISHYGKKSLYEEILNTTNEIDISGFIDGEFGIEVNHKRDKLNPVMVELSFPQTFYQEAFNLLNGLYEQYGLYAHARINIYRRDPVDTTLYPYVKSMLLDFSTAIVHKDSIEIKCMEISLHKYIRSSGGTKFDLKVSDLNPAKFKYDRIRLEQVINYSPLLPSGTITRYEMNHYYVLAVQLGKYIGQTGSIKHEFKSSKASEDYSTDVLNNADYFFKAGEEVTLKIYSDFTMQFGPSNYNFTQGAYFTFGVRSPDGTIESYYQFDIDKDLKIKVEIEGGGLRIPLQPGDELFVYLNLFVASGGTVIQPYYRSLEMAEFKSFYFQYDDTGETIYLDVVTPEKVLESLMSEMTNNLTGVDSSIKWSGDDVNFSRMLVAAESIRQLNEPYFHVSFNDFAKWMDVLGYGYEYIGDKSISFKKYDEFFQNQVTLSLNEKENADLIIQPDTDFAYTSFKIGQEREEYDDNVNGRLEPSGTFEYQTGYLSDVENTLELISPFRFDSLGVELLCWKRPDQGQEQSDNKSDNDVFCIALQKSTIVDENGNNIQGYILYEPVKYYIPRDYYLFNAVFSAYHLVIRNVKRLGIITDKISFASTTSNRNAILYGTNIDLYGDIATPDKFFSPKTYNIACGYKTNIPIIEIPNGIVEFKYENKTYRGYIKQAIKNYNREAETTMTLLAIE